MRAAGDAVRKQCRDAIPDGCTSPLLRCIKTCKNAVLNVFGTIYGTHAPSLLTRWGRRAWSRRWWWWTGWIRRRWRPWPWWSRWPRTWSWARKRGPCPSSASGLRQRLAAQGDGQDEAWRCRRCWQRAPCSAIRTGVLNVSDYVGGNVANHTPFVYRSPRSVSSAPALAAWVAQPSSAPTTFR